MKLRNKEIFLCENCGNEFPVWSGKCPLCGEWNTLKELKIKSGKLKEGAKSEIEVKKLDEIKLSDSGRTSSGISELDRVLGGGIVPGSVILIGGEPGIGKSTLLLQVAGNIPTTFYLSAEESLAQIKMRASRLDLGNKDILLASDGDILSIEREINKIKPKLIIIDSIQTIYLTLYDATPGSLVQVRECGIYLQQLAKKSGIPIIIIGHVTKEGNIAGPRILEHLVDSVLYLEGERFNDARILRGVKNRFGPTNEVGIFSMQEKGMIPVNNPSELFLSERQNSPGSVTTVVLEGTRPILIEVQALVIPTHFGYPKRTSSGFDLNRLNLLAAVISKKTPINLSNHDIYLNIVGGLKVREPAIDLAVCSAIISSFRNKMINKDQCVFGEVGLSGEIRKVTKANERVKEARSLGYLVLEDVKNISDLIKILA